MANGEYSEKGDIKKDKEKSVVNYKRCEAKFCKYNSFNLTFYKIMSVYIKLNCKILLICISKAVLLTS